MGQRMMLERGTDGSENDAGEKDRLMGRRGGGGCCRNRGRDLELYIAQ